MSQKYIYTSTALFLALSMSSSYGQNSADAGAVFLKTNSNPGIKSCNSPGGRMAL